MGAPIGNKFWELRSRHGRKRLFESPDDMWEAACEYFEWCEEHTLPEHDFVGKDATEVIRNKMRPFTMEGLCSYLDCNTMYFNQFEKSIKEKDDKLSKDFSLVVSRIRETVFNQQYTGAAAGFLNANIVARRNGIAERQDNRQVDKDGNDIAPSKTILVVRSSDDEIGIKEREE